MSYYGYIQDEYSTLIIICKIKLVLYYLSKVLERPQVSKPLVAGDINVYLAQPEGARIEE